MNKPQIVEAGFRKGKMRVILDPSGPAVDGAGSAGLTAGGAAVAAAVEKAIGPTVRRAEKLLAVVLAANRTEAEQKERLTAIEREKTAAPKALFGSALTARLEELEAERVAAYGLMASASREREHAREELIRVRDAAVADAPKAVDRALGDRLAAAEIEREKAAEALAAVLAEHLARVLRLDSERDALDRVKAADAVKAALEEMLPDVFAESGIAPHTPYDPRADREPPRPIGNPRFKRRGWEHEYGLPEDAFEEEV